MRKANQIQGDRIQLGSSHSFCLHSIMIAHRVFVQVLHLAPCVGNKWAETGVPDEQNDMDLFSQQLIANVRPTKNNLSDIGHAGNRLSEINLCWQSVKLNLMLPQEVCRSRMLNDDSISYQTCHMSPFYNQKVSGQFPEWLFRLGRCGRPPPRPNEIQGQNER